MVATATHSELNLSKKCDLALFQKGRLKRNMQCKGHTKTSELPYWAGLMFCVAFRPHISFYSLITKYIKSAPTFLELNTRRAGEAGVGARETPAICSCLHQMPTNPALGFISK